MTPTFASEVIEAARAGETISIKAAADARAVILTLTADSPAGRYSRGTSIDFARLEAAQDIDDLVAFETRIMRTTARNEIARRMLPGLEDVVKVYPDWPADKHFWRATLAELLDLAAAGKLPPAAVIEDATGRHDAANFSSLKFPRASTDPPTRPAA